MIQADGEVVLCVNALMYQRLPAIAIRLATHSKPNCSAASSNVDGHTVAVVLGDRVKTILVVN